MKKYILMLFASVSLASCIDTVLLPDNMTVDEDFWQSKEEVSSMVAGAYQTMLKPGFQQRLIVWGDYRSDELVKASGPTGGIPDDLEEIEGGAIQTDNQFNSWGSLYSVIQNCNIVLEKAEGVMKLDPNYTEGDYLSDRSQMLALRALCYFYLVRTFRDVPYIDKAYLNSSQEMNVTQEAPEVVLNKCIADLEEAKKNAIDPDGIDGWRRCGYINRNGINAMLADIYLWLASVKQSSDPATAKQYYQKCVDYCQEIIDYKNQHFVPTRNDVVDETDPAYIYHLYPYNQYFANTYSNNNGSNREAIFEVYFSNANSNTDLCQMYHRYSGSGTPTSFLVAPSCYSNPAGSYAGYSEDTYAKSVYDDKDMRLFNNIYGANSSSTEFFYVRKFVEMTGRTALTSEKRPNTRAYGGYEQNWIIYKLTDVMLMKAEALVQLAENDNTDIRVRQAFNLVQIVNARALHADNKSDSLIWSRCSGFDMEKLVLAERSRELAFEGKRWYDMMRYNYRHITPADYTKTLGQLSKDGVTFATHSDFFKSLLMRKYSGGAGTAVLAKMPNEAYLYMPIIQSEMDVNKNLVQNPVYSSNKQWKKDY